MLTKTTTRIGVFSGALRRYGAGRRERFGRAAVLAVMVGALACLAQGRAEAGWDSIGPAGGTVTAVLASPASTSTLYAGTPENGVFFSTDAGATWASASAGLPASTAIGRQALVAVYALTTDGQFVYAATAAGLFYTVAGTAPVWVPLAPTASATPITLLAFDPNTRRLFAATNQTDGAATPGVHVAQTGGAGGPPSAWTFVPLPAPAGTPVGALALVPAIAPLTPASLMVGVGSNMVTASIDPVALGLNWIDGDSSASLALSPVTALAYSSEFQQAFACSGGTVFHSGNPLSSQALWLPATVEASGAIAFSCNAFQSVPIALGGAPQLMLGTDQGAFVSLDGVSFAATGSLGMATSANAFAIGQRPGAPESTLFVGTGYGIASTGVNTLTKSASWSASNGPASVLAGGDNLRLNNTNIVDTAVLGSTLYGAAVANPYVEVLYSHDGGASWSATHIDTALGNGEQVISLVADTAHSALYAATTQGLLAFSPTSARWSAVAASAIVGRVGALALGATALFVGTDDGLYAVPLSGAPASALPVAAGLARHEREDLAGGGWRPVCRHDRFERQQYRLHGQRIRRNGRHCRLEPVRRHPDWHRPDHQPAAGRRQPACRHQWRPGAVCLSGLGLGLGEHEPGPGAADLGCLRRGQQPLQRRHLDLRSHRQQRYLRQPGRRHPSHGRRSTVRVPLRCRRWRCTRCAPMATRCTRRPGAASQPSPA